jgi:hypothetical protein
VSSYQTIALLGSKTSSSAEKVATFPGFWAETSTLVALWAAVDLGEPLTVVGTFAPASSLAAFVAGGAFAFGAWEVIDVNIACGLTGDDLVPVDGLDVAQVVIVQHADTSSQYIYKMASNIIKKYSTS